MYTRLKELYKEIKSHTDLTHKSIPFFVGKVNEVRVELLKITAEQGEQVTREISDATRLIFISQREDLNNIVNYPKEIPKYLSRIQVVLVNSLKFVEKMR